MAVDIKEAMVQASDLANQIIVGHVASRSLRLMLFTTTINAQWGADRIIKSAAYPLATLSLIANRNSFRLEVGDNFRHSISRLSIVDMVFRIARISESNLEKEEIKINAIEDIEYLSTPGTYATIPEGDNPSESRQSVSAFLYFGVIEAPYVVSENSIMIIPLVGRVTGTEQGYSLYFGTSGSSYTLLQNVTTFASRGILETDYTSNTLEIDDVVGFEVTILSSDGGSSLETITRELLFGSSHLAFIGGNAATGELITWQTITPVVGYTNRYLIEGIYRNRFGSSKIYHSAGTEIWFVGNNFTSVSNAEFTVGSTRYFKMVPYAGSRTISLANCGATSVSLIGVARNPYDPTNLACNGLLVLPTYSGLCYLTWSPRIRGDGAGLENPDYDVDPGAEWEGLFLIEVWVNSVKVRTQLAIDAVAWTYTAAMNVSDNGSLADTITFKIKNYIVYQSLTYYSEYVSLTVNKE